MSEERCMLFKIYVDHKSPYIVHAALSLHAVHVACEGVKLQITGLWLKESSYK